MNKFKLCKVCSIPTSSERRTTFYDDVKVALGSWDGNENDHDIFFYMDGEPLEVGLVIAEDFIVLEIQESEVNYELE